MSRAARIYILQLIHSEKVAIANKPDLLTYLTYLWGPDVEEKVQK